MTLSEDGALATKSGTDEYTWRAAASKVVMWSGCHFVQFTMVSGESVTMMFGVIRPGWDVRGGRGGGGGCRQPLLLLHGRRETLPEFSDWEGMRGAEEDGDRIGMLLNLDHGSMTIW